MDENKGRAVVTSELSALLGEGNFELLTEHNGCGRGPQRDQLTVLLHPGDRVVLLRGPMARAIARVEAKTPNVS